MYKRQNIITTIAKDNAGIETTDTRTINYDPISPILTVTAPADNSKTNNPEVTITGSVDEAATAAVTLNNGTPGAAVMTGNAFSFPLVLANGLNTIDITVTDRAGNTSSAKRSITCDNIAPSLAITEPAQDMIARESTVILKGIVTDITDVTVSVTFDGATAIIPVINNAFSIPLTFTAAKTYTIIVIARDATGNESSATRNIISAVSRLSLPLSQGWNFVSTPIQPTDPKIESVLADVSVNTVWAYNGQTQTWKKYKASAAGNELTTIDAGVGYWIYMDSAAQLTLSLIHI